MAQRGEAIVMKAWRVILIAAVVLIVLLVVGVIAGRVGGIAIRKQGAAADPLRLVVSEPVLRGVPVVVRWEMVDSEMSHGVVRFIYRDTEMDYPLGEAAVEQQEALLIFPCGAAESTGSLVVRIATTDRVLSSRLVELAAPGRECVQ